MKIIDALGALDSLKHNTYSQPEKIAWLNRVDSQVKMLIVDTHEGSENCTFSGYDENTPLSTQLLIPAPFDEIYLYFMAAQIDLNNGETALYNESITLYNTAWAGFERWYNRNYMPKGTRIQYF